MDKIQNESENLVITHRLLYRQLSTGDAQYHNVTNMALVEYDIWNKTKETIDVTLVSEIKDYSHKRHDTPPLAPGQHLICRQLPLIDGTRTRLLQGDMPAQISITYKYEYAGKSYEPQNDESLTLMAYNTIVWAIPHPSEKCKRTYFVDHLVAWIYDVDDAVKQMQDTLMQQPELKGKRLGYRPYYDDAFPRACVKTIFNTLREKNKLEYRDNSEVTHLNRETSQSVKRPGDTLHDGNGNCIDGAVLYASLIKFLRLDPLIVIKKEHAFVGWKTCSNTVWKNLPDEEKRKKARYEFLDTTWTSDLEKSFEDACEKGNKLYAEILQNNWTRRRPFPVTNTDFAYVLDVKVRHKRLEQAKANPLFYIQLPAENPSHVEEKPLLPAEKIIRLLPPLTVTNTTEQCHLIASSRFVIQVEQSLAEIRPEMSDLTLPENRTYAIGQLELIHRPDLPEVDIFSKESTRALQLRQLYAEAKDLKSSIHDLQLQDTLPAPASVDSFAARRSPPAPDIHLLYKQLVQETDTIAGELKTELYQDLLQCAAKVAEERDADRIPGDTDAPEAEAS